MQIIWLAIFMFSAILLSYGMVYFELYHFILGITFYCISIYKLSKIDWDDL